MYNSRNAFYLSRLVANTCCRRRPAITNSMRSISHAIARNGSRGQPLISMPSMARLTAIGGVRQLSNSHNQSHPQVDEELQQFLKSEIELEKKSATGQQLPSIPGWQTTHEGSNVVFTKTYGSEQITVRTNINHSVDTKGFEPVDDGSGAPPPAADISAQMVCRPDFAVEIKKGSKVLGINCSFVDLEDMDDDMAADGQQQGSAAALEDGQSLEDEFQINELSIYEGDFKDSSYLVAGDVMDGSMYDLMMDMLHDRGVDHQFARNIIEYATAYDHRQYLSLLEQLRDFVAKK